jgi:hypothetical protein
MLSGHLRFFEAICIGNVRFKNILRARQNRVFTRSFRPVVLADPLCGLKRKLARTHRTMRLAAETIALKTGGIHPLSLQPGPSLRKRNDNGNPAAKARPVCSGLLFRDIQQVVDEAGRAPLAGATHLEFALSLESGLIVISVIDAATHAVVRRIPLKTLAYYARSQPLGGGGMILDANG